MNTETVKTAIFGVVGGFVAGVIISAASWGFDWSTPGTVAKARAAGMTAGAQSILVPYCTAQMLGNKEALEKIKTASSWQRGDVVEEIATAPGGGKYDDDTADACAAAAYEKATAAAAKSKT